LVKGGGDKITLKEWVKGNGPWTFETKSFFDVLAAQKTTQPAETL